MSKCCPGCESDDCQCPEYPPEIPFGIDDLNRAIQFMRLARFILVRANRHFRTAQSDMALDHLMFAQKHSEDMKEKL